jgi:hypothetical protein
MANLYENIPEMQARAQANEQRRRIAEAMLAQSQEQVQPFVNTGRLVAPMSWTQGLAQMVKAYGAGRGLKKADEGDAQLAKEHAAKAAEALSAYRTQSQGAPERAPAPIAPMNGVGPPRPTAGPPVPAVPADPRGAIQALLANQYAPPEAKQAALVAENWRRDDATSAENRTWRREDLLLQQQTKLAEIEARLQDRALDRQMREDLAREANATRLQIAQMTGALRQEPAPAQTEIIDPKDPTRMLKIDMRTYKPGGSLGDPGVIGIAGKEPAAAKAAETRGTGLKAVDEQVANLRDLYNQLDEGGGIIDPEKGAISNAGAWVKSRGVGQTAGNILGTKNQSARNQIAQQRPLLLRAIMAATGMSARSLDSNAELKLWLSAATDPQLDVASNRAALDNIEKQYGSAAVGKAPADPAAPAVPAAPTGGSVLKFDLQGNPIK